MKEKLKKINESPIDDDLINPPRQRREAIQDKSKGLKELPQ
jgi:hypothetical protein